MAFRPYRLMQNLPHETPQVHDSFSEFVMIQVKRNLSETTQEEFDREMNQDNRRLRMGIPPNVIGVMKMLPIDEQEEIERRYRR